MATNFSLYEDCVAKHDDFYTQYESKQDESNHYEKHFEETMCKRW